MFQLRTLSSFTLSYDSNAAKTTPSFSSHCEKDEKEPLGSPVRARQKSFGDLLQQDMQDDDEITPLLETVQEKYHYRMERLQITNGETLGHYGKANIS